MSEPTHEHICQKGSISIAYPDGHGQVISRQWVMYSCVLAALAAAFGPASSEAMFTTEAAEQAGRLIAATPGVVIAPSQETNL